MWVGLLLSICFLVGCLIVCCLCLVVCLVYVAYVRSVCLAV